MTEGLVAYSYDQARFAEFYDNMVHDCYGGTESEDVAHLVAVVAHTSAAVGAAAPAFRLVDLGCGSARFTRALLEALASAVDAGAPPPITQPLLEVLCIDNSEVMLAAARSHLAGLLDAHPLLAATFRVTFVNAAFQDWDVPASWRVGDGGGGDGGGDGGGAHAIVLAAAGLHHLTSHAELAQSMLRICAHLAPPSAVAIVTYLPWAELAREEETAAPRDDTHASTMSAEGFVVGPYVRTRLAHELHTRPDGSCLLYERFRLEKRIVPAAAATSAPHEWSMEEDWTLMRLERPQLEAAAAAAGLQPVACPLTGAAAAWHGAGDVLYLRTISAPPAG